MSFAIRKGMLVTKSPEQEPWTVIDGDGVRSHLKRSFQQKWILDKSIQATYYDVHSAKYQKLLEEWKRHGWKVW
jgi:hypothetical protein